MDLSRTTLLLGTAAAARLARLRVIIFGVGGVGSWCAEALVRTGFTHLTLVDNDTVSPSNVNRQLMATSSTIGRRKVDALGERLLDINPEADIVARPEIYCAATADGFGLEGYDIIIDCIDALAEKTALILHATSLPTRPLFLSSMGAALKLDPTQVSVAEFWRVKGCPLARALRQRMKRSGTLPRRKFHCVYSPELYHAPDPPTPAASDAYWDTRKAQINGSLVHITAIFGMTLAGLAVKHIVAQT